jgi:hypothetical protein
MRFGHARKLLMLVLLVAAPYEQLPNGKVHEIGFVI